MGLYFNELIILGVILIVSIFALRLLGAWMLRIDEVIKHQKEIVKQLKKLNNDDGTIMMEDLNK